MKKDRSIDVLPAVGIFSSLEESDLEVLSGFGKFIKFDSKETVIQEDEAQNSLYFVISGVLHAIHKVKDGATPVGTIKEGECFGEVNMFDPAVASAVVVAHDEVQVWRISRDNLEKFININPQIGCVLFLGIAEVMARRIRTMIKKVNATWEISW